MSICAKESNCAGCTACKTICPNKAINMIPNKNGFLIPKVDFNLCIECDLCVSVCPLSSQEKTEITNSYQIQAFAFINQDDELRYTSTSGGFFISIAKIFFESDGYVCGCILENMIPKHVVTNEWELITKMQGSKYVQSDMGNCIEQIVTLISCKKRILFTGTSCQISGLKSILKIRNLSDENLLCVDFLCHGVPSPKIWNDFVRYYETHRHKKVFDFKFRNKKYGWGKSSLGGDFLSYAIIVNKNQSKRTESWSYLSRIWRYIFFSNICIRANCYQCPYASIYKPADITMADFWGIEKIDENFDDGRGCSLILIQNAKGRKFFEKCKENKKLEVNVDLAIQDQKNAFKPSTVNVRRTEFWRDYHDKGFSYVIKKYFGYNIKGKIKAFIKRFLFELKIRYLY